MRGEEEQEQEEEEEEEEAEGRKGEQCRTVPSGPLDSRGVGFVAAQH